jgi:hypothetical protein
VLSSDSSHFDFCRLNLLLKLLNPSSHTVALGSTRPLTERSTQESSLRGDKALPARQSDNLKAICEPIENMEVSTSHNPMVLYYLLQG